MSNHPQPDVLFGHAANPDAEVQAHVDGCAVCRQEVAAGHEVGKPDPYSTLT